MNPPETIEALLDDLEEAAHSEGYSLALQTHPMQPYSDRTKAAREAVLAALGVLGTGDQTKRHQVLPDSEKP